MACGLAMRWVPVVDERGRTRLEARWAVASRRAVTAPAARTSQTHAA